MTQPTLPDEPFGDWDWDVLARFGAGSDDDDLPPILPAPLPLPPRPRSATRPPLGAPLPARGQPLLGSLGLTLALRVLRELGSGLLSRPGLTLFSPITCPPRAL